MPLLRYSFLLVTCPFRAVPLQGIMSHCVAPRFHCEIILFCAKLRFAFPLLLQAARLNSFAERVISNQLNAFAMLRKSFRCRSKPLLLCRFSVNHIPVLQHHSPHPQAGKSGAADAVSVSERPPVKFHSVSLHSLCPPNRAAPRITRPYIASPAASFSHRR